MYLDTPNKKNIRVRWDTPILQAAVLRIGRSLAYFGMPGARIHDLLDWSELLGTKTCVQIVRSPRNQQEEDLDVIRQITHNVLVNDVKNVQIMRGAVEDILIKGSGLDHLAPKVSELVDGHRRFRYDLYNLDFFGGVGYKRKASEGTKGVKTARVKAIEDMFARQRGHDFTLLLTINVRDTFGEEPLQYLQETLSRSGNTMLADTFAWCASLDAGKKHHQLKVWIPLWVRELAEMAQFDCRCYPTVTYEGHERARMVHFAFDFAFIDGRDLRVDSRQTLDSVVQLPLLQMADGEFRFLTLPGSPCGECMGPDSVVTSETLSKCLGLTITEITLPA
jgi:hypothetical protein